MVNAPRTPRKGGTTWDRRTGFASPPAFTSASELALNLVVWGVTSVLIAPMIIFCHLTSLFVTAFTEPNIWNDTPDTESPFGAGTTSEWRRLENGH